MILLVSLLHLVSAAAHKMRVTIPTVVIMPFSITPTKLAMAMSLTWPEQQFSSYYWSLSELTRAYTYSSECSIFHTIEDGHWAPPPPSSATSEVCWKERQQSTMILVKWRKYIVSLTLHTSQQQWMWQQATHTVKRTRAIFMKLSQVIWNEIVQSACRMHLPYISNNGNNV